jgi:subfamily B ATP-binding cassette protein MsbA
MKLSKYEKELYLSLFSYLKVHKARIILAISTMIILGLIRAAIVYLVGPFIKEVFVSRNTETLRFFFIILPVVFFIRMLAEYSNNYLMNYIGQKVVQKIREEIFIKIHHLPLEFFWRSRTGDIMSRVMNDIGNIQSTVQFIPLYGIRDLSTVIFLVATLFYINFKLAFFSIVFVPVSLYALRIFARKMRNYSRQAQHLIADVSNSFEESLCAYTIVKAYNYDDEVIRRFRFINQEYFNRIMKYLRATSLSGPVMEFIGSMTIYLLIFVGFRWILKGELSSETFFSFIAAFITAYTPFKNISNMNSRLQMGLASWERIYNLLNEKDVVVVKKNAVVLKELKGMIEFKNVYYKYPTSCDWVLKNVSFKIMPNEVVGFVGGSGSGKSTIIHLILRFFDVCEGVILIDGIDIRDIDIKSFRNFVGLVTQDTIVFNDTVLNNIKVGNLNASDEDIINACEISDSMGFINNMPEKLNTVIGEKGSKLSGGQRQRLAIARAVIRKPKILLLDEATSNLDSKSEEIVQKAIEKNLNNKTVIMTAHRLSTVKNTNKIFVLRKGEIVESGTHNELIKKEGEYYTLYKKQNI